jgi:hypothetical protein
MVPQNQQFSLKKKHAILHAKKINVTPQYYEFPPRAGTHLKKKDRRRLMTEEARTLMQKLPTSTCTRI